MVRRGSSVRLAFSVVLGVALLASSAPANAAGVNEPAPGWAIDSVALPSHLQPGGSGSVYLQPMNVGAADSSGPVTIVDTLPPGITATDAGAVDSYFASSATKPDIDHSSWECGIAPGMASPPNSVVTCANNQEAFPSITGGGSPPTGLPSQAAKAGELGREPPLLIKVDISASAPEAALPNQMSVSGGGAGSVVASDPVVIGADPATFGVSRWQGWFSNADGSPDTQAGSVPYAFTTSIDLDALVREQEGSNLLTNAGDEARAFIVNLPPGFVGNPNAVPQCARSLFVAAKCPKAAQVGKIRVFTVPGVALAFHVWNLPPPPGVPAQFGFNILGINTFLEPSLRTGSDYGLDADVNNAPQKEVLSSILTLWGVPGDPSHNVWRDQGTYSGCREIFMSPGGQCNPGPHPALKPFLRMPTSCAGPAPFALSINGWRAGFTAFTEPVTFFTQDSQGEPQGLTGCNQLPFDPTITSKPTTNVADAPTGLEFDLHIPQPEVVNPIEGQAKYPIEDEVPGETRTIGAEPERHEADLKNAVVTLPKGVSVNPASANGLSACSSAQFGLTSAIGATPITTTPGPAQCPDAAKIGTVEVITPLLREHNQETGEPTIPHPVKGGVYVAAPQNNPFGSLLAIYLAINDPVTGTVIKLAGKVNADPQTGQLETVFANNPQLPFEDFHLNFFKGAHAALRTPQTCGTFATTTDMTPWSTPEGADATPGDSFETTQGADGAPCAASDSALPNKPSFTAGTLQPKAGAYSPFVLHLARPDGSQELKAIDTTLPEGLLGKLAGISECSDAQIAQANSRNKLGDGALEKSSPSCPLNSEVGTVNVGAGAGPDPYYVTGHAYLAGPYKGAPLSLEIITPAVAGPYDLGAVAVRTALYVNSETAQIHAVSDELPHILQGIPLDVRAIDLQMARPNFTLNPTSCAKKTILGSATSVLGNAASLSSPFQVGECSVLGFKPKLAIHLKGDTKRSGNPALRATVTYPSKGAYSNIASASVALPHSEFLDQAHIKTICTRVQFAEGNVPGEKCPSGSIYGHARATTPLLDQPLEGPVYLRSSSHPLPDLVAALNGQIQVVLDGTIDSIHGGIRNRFEVVPDAPVSKFTLTMQGGKKGLLENSKNLCKSTNRATANFTAQNGKTYDSRPVVTNSCKKSAKGKGKHKGHKHRGKK